jgi:hypothetical protein
MKAQVSNLISGRKNVLRDLNHVKYSDAKIATSHIGYAGTNKEVRNRIAALVREENKDGLDAEIRGIDLHLNYEESISGKTCQWLTKLTADQYKALDGENAGASACEKFHIQINADCTVEIFRYKRNNERQQWKMTNWSYVGEELVTIK